MERRRGANSDNPLWNFIPVVFTTLAVLMTMVPFGLSSAVLAPPSFGLVAVFLWAVYRPDLLPPAVVFAMGLLQDLLWGGPLGLWAFVFLASYLLSETQRLVLIGQGFGFMWAGFGMVAGVAGILSWLAASAYYGQFVPLVPVLVQAVLSLAVFPLIQKLVPRSFVIAAQAGVVDD